LYCKQHVVYILRCVSKCSIITTGTTAGR
jgi:hypothetical protein